MAIKISAGVVVTANDRMDVWQPGYVVVRDGSLAEAGPGPGPDGDFAERIEAPSSIVIPGLLNAHSHSPSNLLKGSWSRLKSGVNTSAPGGANIPTRRSTSAPSWGSSK